MVSLSAALNASAVSLSTLEQGLDVVQNNVTNASTPGYAAQSANFSAVPFDPSEGTAGGVEFAGAQSSRDEYAERYVQEQQSALGTSQSIVNTLSPLQSSFDVTGNSGLDNAFSQFFSAFSALSENPNDASARQQVLTSAQNVATQFQSIGSATAQASQSASQQIGSTVSQINNLASQIQQINSQIVEGSQPDANRDATLHSDLETLSGLVNITTGVAQNGTMTVLIDGQTPLVLGTNAYPIGTGTAPVSATAPNPSGTPSQIITDSNGTDITAQVSGGQLSGLLQVRNTTLASIQGDTNQTGSLNELAKGFADSVNSLLTSGEISSGPPAVPGVAMFQYDTTNSTNIAQSLTVSSISSSQIATIAPGPPYSANGVAQQIGDLPTSTSPTQQISGLSITDFYSQIASNLGQQVSNAQTNQTQQTQAVAQAQNLRSQVSGVSLDQEAVKLTDFQKSYEAIAKMVTVLDDLTETTINILPT